MENPKTSLRFRQKKLLVSVASIFFLSIVASGCNSGMSSLTGTVTFSDDGSPLTAGEVRFESNNHLARGMLDEKGRYTIRSTESAKGLPPGRYRVCIVGAVKPVGKDDAGMDILESLIDSKYESITTSGLELEVTDKASQYDFQVDRKAS